MIHKLFGVSTFFIAKIAKNNDIFAWRVRKQQQSAKRVYCEAINSVTHCFLKESFTTYKAHSYLLYN